MKAKKEMGQKNPITNHLLSNRLYLQIIFFGYFMSIFGSKMTQKSLELLIPYVCKTKTNFHTKENPLQKRIGLMKKIQKTQPGSYFTDYKIFAAIKLMPENRLSTHLWNLVKNIYKHWWQI